MAICNLMIILSVSACLVGNLRTPSVNAVVFVCICRVVPSLPSSFTSPQQTVEISTKIIWLLQIFCHSTQNMINDEYKSIKKNCGAWQSHIFYILIIRARCWVAAHMCVISHFRTCNVRAEAYPWKCVRSACVWTFYRVQCAIAHISHFFRKVQNI